MLLIPRPEWQADARQPIPSPELASPLITAIYPFRRQKVATIKKPGMLCPIFDDEFSPSGEFSAYMTAKSPSGEIST
jgi:hypothetical protein